MFLSFISLRRKLQENDYNLKFRMLRKESRTIHSNSPLQDCVKSTPLDDVVQVRYNSKRKRDLEEDAARMGIEFTELVRRKLDQPLLTLAVQS